MNCFIRKFFSKLHSFLVLGDVADMWSLAVPHFGLWKAYNLENLGMFSSSMLRCGLQYQCSGTLPCSLAIGFDTPSDAVYYQLYMNMK